MGGRLPGIHPDRHDRQKALVGGEFAFAFAKARVWDVEERLGHMACTLHGPEHLGEEAQYGIGKIFSFSGGPPVEPSGSPGRPPFDEVDEGFVGEGERGGGDGRG